MYSKTLRGLLILLAAIFLGWICYVLGKRNSNSEIKRTVSEFNSNLTRAVQEINSNQSRSVSEWFYKSVTIGISPSNVALVERNKPWEQTLPDLRKELSFCRNWFDTINTLSVWLYQNTRVGSEKFNIEKSFGNDFNKWVDTAKTCNAEWFYAINMSDSVASSCGAHCYFASQVYKEFGIKSYHLSMRDKHGNSMDGHLINVVQNPHNYKWYPVDNMFGIRWIYQGKPVDMETYMNLSKNLKNIDIERFGAYKFHIYDSPFITNWNCCYENSEVVLVEAGNHKNRFRIVAPYTLKKQFQYYQPLFDSIAASYNQPPHTDWIDLARRMPVYGARLFSSLNYKEQPQADSLLNAWRNAAKQ